MDLIKKKCVPCEGGTSPLSLSTIQVYCKQIIDWKVVEDNKKIQKIFILPGFKKAMVLVNHIADIAEEEGHHPDIHIFYKKVVIELWTHAINGLSENDFIVAAKIDSLDLSLN